MNTILYYSRQTTEECKGILYPSKTHPFVYGKSGCIYTSGCGVCSSLMVLRNSLNVSTSIKEWANTCLSIGARNNFGTDMSVVAKYLNKTYSIDFLETTNTDMLVNHLKNGYKAIIDVSGGGKQLFSNQAHFVTGAGIDMEGKLIILDSFWYNDKFTLTPARTKYLTVKNEFEVYVSPSALQTDVKTYWLFTPKSKNQIKYSVNDINFKKENTL